MMNSPASKGAPKGGSQVRIIPRLDVALLKQSAIVFACAMPLTVALAASDGEHREHEAHEHGRGMLDIVAEGEELVVEFRIPAANVVGFEHAPRDDAEREAVHEAAETFRDPASVLVLPAEAECEVEEAEAGIVGMGADEHDDHDDHDDHAHEGEDHDHDGDEHAKEEHEEEGEDHDHDHAKEEHEEEDEDHDHAKEEHEAHDEHSADSDGEAHSELRATYHFHCHAPERLVRIEVRVFEHLRDAEEIDVRVVTATAQTAMELHPGETVVELSH